MLPQPAAPGALTVASAYQSLAYPPAPQCSAERSKLGCTDVEIPKRTFLSPGSRAGLGRSIFMKDPRAGRVL